MLLMYALAYSVLCGYGYSDNSKLEYLQKPVTENYKSIFTGNQPGAALQAVKPIEGGVNFSYLQSKKTVNDFSEILKSVDRLLISSFTSYESLSDNIAVGQRKADIIFPFHYFW